MEISVRERIYFGALYPKEGDLINQKLVKDITAKVELSQEEMEEIELKAVDTGLQWNIKKAKDKNIEFTEIEIDLLKIQAKELNDTKKITQNTLSLCEKFLT